MQIVLPLTTLWTHFDPTLTLIRSHKKGFYIRRYHSGIDISIHWTAAVILAARLKAGSTCTTLSLRIAKWGGMILAIVSYSLTWLYWGILFTLIHKILVHSFSLYSQVREHDTGHCVILPHLVLLRVLSDDEDARKVINGNPHSCIRPAHEPSAFFFFKTASLRHVVAM